MSIQTLEQFMCPKCKKPATNPETNEFIIPKYYIGDEYFGYKCSCGRILSISGLMKMNVVRHIYMC